MHHQNNRVDILCIATNDFSNSMRELKEHLNFNLVFKKNNQTEEEHHDYDGVLVHENMLEDPILLKVLKKVNSIKILIFLRLIYFLVI